MDKLGQDIAVKLLAENTLTISLFSGAFKPPTRSHFQIVENAAKLSDQVQVIISNQLREGYSPELSLKIWKQYAKLLPENVSFQIAKSYSPITEIYNIVKEKSNNYIVLFGKNDSDRFNSINENRDKYSNVEVLDVGQLGDVSATKLREAISKRNKLQIKSLIPERIKVNDFLLNFQLHEIKVNKPSIFPNILLPYKDKIDYYIKYDAKDDISEKSARVLNYILQNTLKGGWDVPGLNSSEEITGHILSKLYKNLQFYIEQSHLDEIKVTNPNEKPIVYIDGQLPFIIDSNKHWYYGHRVEGDRMFWERRGNNDRFKEAVKYFKGYGTVKEGFYLYVNESDVIIKNVLDGLDEIKINNPLSPLSLPEFQQKIHEIGNKIGWYQVENISKKYGYNIKSDSISSFYNKLSDTRKNQFVGELIKLNEIKINKPFPSFPITLTNTLEAKEIAFKLYNLGYKAPWSDSERYYYEFPFQQTEDGENFEPIILKADGKELEWNTVRHIDYTVGDDFIMEVGKQEIKKVLGEIKVNNPNNIKLIVGNYYDLLMSGKWESGYEMEKENDEQVQFINTKSGQLIADKDRLKLNKNIRPSQIQTEIKVNKPGLNFPIKIKTPEQAQKIGKELVRQGYKMGIYGFNYIKVYPFFQKSVETYFPFVIYKENENEITWTGDYIDIIHLNESIQINPKQYIKLLNTLLEDCCRELEIQKPIIKLINNDKYTKEHKSYGGYMPDTNEIKLVIYGRLLKDSCTTLAHECYHSYQMNNNLLTPDSGKDGDDIENAANSFSGRFMRQFGRQHPEIYFMRYDKN